MSDNEDLLGDDLGDHSLADYNLGNDEEEQLLADDYESGPQNVPTSIEPNYIDGSDISSSDYSGHVLPYSQDPLPYQPPAEECVVPNITVEVPNTPIRDHPTYAPYQPPVYEVEHAVVPPAIPAAPIESPQIVPSELNAAVPNGEGRERFHSERPPGAPQRTPQLRDIPDSLDKVFVPRGGFGGRGRTSWRSAQFQARFQQPYNHPYRRNNMQRGNFLQRASFPPPARSPGPRPEPAQPARPELRPELPRPMPPMGPEISPERPMLPPDRPMMPETFVPSAENRSPFPPYQFGSFRPNMEDRPNFPRPNFDPRFFRPPFNPRPFGPPIREIVPNSNHMPQIIIRQVLPGLPLPQNVPKLEEFGPKREPEVRMLPMQLPPGGLAGKKVLINPHFKGNFQPPVEGLPVLPTYIPTRIQKTPPLSPPQDKLGPIKDIDDAAERFIAEQTAALARAAGRKFTRRSPQRFIENTTIEIENELAPEPAWRDDELLRRQEEFIHDNMAGLRRRMRSPSPARRSPSPRRSPERRRAERRPPDEDSEYRRRVREQESLRERVLRAKEVRRKRNAQALHKQLQERERAPDPPAAPPAAPAPPAPAAAAPPAPPAAPAPPAPPAAPAPAPASPPPRPDTTKGSPRPDKDPAKDPEVNSTCEGLTPPRALTPPLPRRYSDDDDLAFILGDIDDMLSDDDDTGRFKDKPNSSAPAPPPKPPVDLRSKLPPKACEPRAPRQKIVFAEDKEPRKRKVKDKSPPPTKRPTVTSSTKTDVDNVEKKSTKTNQSDELSSKKSRPRIIFENRESQREKQDEKKTVSRRVVLQRKVSQTEKSVFSRIEVKSDPTKPNPGIFSRAVRTAIGTDKPRIVVKQDEPEIEYESDSDLDEDKLLNDESGTVATVTNLPHGITDTRLKTLAGNEVQSLSLDKEDRSAKITFKTTAAADVFRKKFNNKMVAASRLTVTLR